MDTKILLYTFGMWFVFVIAAILNGGFREKFVTLRLGKQTAHVISTFIFMCAILTGTYLFLDNLSATLSRNDLLLIGGFWLAMTILFEFVFGHYVMGHPWETLLADYNIFKGRVWILVPITTLFAPLFVGTYF
ncbi:hypothetical protein [Methanosarcina sp. DH2]|jgi:hypothetical protein|uniref:hypothetical protein n=1 Tax=Methanosarcina sp. DH2 TaxID=2605639 RepID=UPI001E60563E|nr:hypothetical protein [Methanosarcina sp. DH2]